MHHFQAIVDHLSHKFPNSSTRCTGQRWRHADALCSKGLLIYTCTDTCFCVHAVLQWISVYRRDVPQFHGPDSPTLLHFGWVAVGTDFIETFAWVASCRLHRNCCFSWDVSTFLQRYQPHGRWHLIAKCTFWGVPKRTPVKKKTNPPGRAGPWTQGFWNQPC